MILSTTEWLLLTTTALGVAGTGYGQWQLRQERQAVARKLVQKEGLDWQAAQASINDTVQSETGLASVGELMAEYWRLVRVIGSVAGHLGRESGVYNGREQTLTLSAARLRAFGHLGHIIRCLQHKVKWTSERTNGQILYLASRDYDTEPTMAVLLEGLSLQEIAALTVCLLAERTTEGSGIEGSLVRMGLREGPHVEA